MQSAGLRRLLHTGGCLRSTDVASLKVLRERTGLGIGLCKKALASGGSVNGALEWLSDNEHVQADKLKAKLHERSTPAGRLGIAVQGNLGVLVEVWPFVLYNIIRAVCRALPFVFTGFFFVHCFPCFPFSFRFRSV